VGLAKPLHLRLFLEGIEVPVISAQVSINSFAPAAAAIQVVPLDQVLDLKPRTMVHLFFLEEPLMRNAETTRTSLADLRGPGSVSNSSGDTDLSDESYKLLFCGELIGYSFAKNPMSRSTVLQCLDHSSYWDSLQATMLDYGPDGNAFVHKASLYASNEALFANVPTQTQHEKLRDWILSKPQTPGLKNVAGLAGGIIALMEIMGGLRQHRLGVNDFFTIAELRCHLLSQVTAEDGDSTSQNLFNTKTFWDWIANNLQNQSGQISLRDMFKMLSQYIYYTIIPNPVAKFDKGAMQQKERIAGYTTKLGKTAKLSTVRGVLQGVSRAFSAPGLVTKHELDTAFFNFSGIITPALSEFPSLHAEAAGLGELLSVMREVYPHSEKGELKARQERILVAVASLQVDINKASEATTQVAGKTVFVDHLARLRTQIFRPDCYMAPPPTCNVIFPEQYSQMTYDRNFLDEVTRVEISCYAAVVGKDALTARHLIQPGGALRNQASEVAKQMTNKWRVLMDHELHTGIIAREEWLPDSFSSGSLRGRDSESAKALKNSTLKWQEQVGLHHFFKYRIGPRSVNVAGRFMPYLVCGFPALVIQKPFYLPNRVVTKLPVIGDVISMIRESKKPALDLGAPPQFLGMIEGMTHIVGQDGGNSQFMMSHCRNHLGIDDEFVGLVLAKTKSSGSTSKPIHYVLTLDAAKEDEKKLKFLRDCTPQNWTKDRQALVTEKELNSTDTAYVVRSISQGVASKTVSVRRTNEKTKTSNSKATISSESILGKTVKVPATPGTTTVGGKGLFGGTVSLIEVLPPSEDLQQYKGAYYFSQILVYENIMVPGGAELEDVPFEYAVQPSWLSTSYDNQNVGPKVYKPFFGCDSIVDQIKLSDAGQIEPRQPEGLMVKPDEKLKTLQERIKTIDAQKRLISIEKAVNVISYLYAKVRSEKLDVDEFVESFTRRPVASKRDLLGAHDLELKIVGGKVEVAKGHESKIGFHTFSVHPLCVEARNLTGLTDNPTAPLATMDPTQRKALAASYDVRWQKLEKVKAYKEALDQGSRGFVG
jgi:hypothetical protein